ncbi:MAG TPA: hypothetical protein DCR69_07540 [Clostridium sp.]|nr:hypothetical protein [Clostridium sp.]
MKKTIISLLIMIGLFTFIGLNQADENIEINNANNTKLLALDANIGIMPMGGDPGEGLPK